MTRPIPTITLIASGTKFKVAIKIIGAINPPKTTTYTRILHNNAFFKRGNFKYITAFLIKLYHAERAESN